MKKENGRVVVSISYIGDGYQEERKVVPYKSWLDALFVALGIGRGFRTEFNVNVADEYESSIALNVVQMIAFRMFEKTRQTGSTYKSWYLQNNYWKTEAELQAHVNLFKTVLRRTFKDELGLDLMKTTLAVVPKRAHA